MTKTKRVRLSAPEPEVLKAMARNSRRRARTSLARDKLTRLSGRLAPDERSANDPALDSIQPEPDGSREFPLTFVETVEAIDAQFEGGGYMQDIGTASS